MELLMRDGRVSVAFSPDLTTPQCDELLKIIQRFSIRATVEDLRQDLEAAALRWNVEVTISRPKA